MLIQQTKTSFPSAYADNKEVMIYRLDFGGANISEKTIA